MIKFQRGGIAVQDNTRVVRKQPLAFRLTKEQQARIRQRRLQEAARRNQAVIYDADKAKYYQNMQNFYNNNFFGYGVFGKQTHYDPSKEGDQKKIQSNFNYAKDNVKNIGTSLITVGPASSFKGVLPSVSRRVTVGKLSALTPYKIGQGSEALVIRNSPTTVGKITQVGSGEMLKRNAIPNSLPLKFVGYVRDGSKRFPTFIQKRVKVLSEKTFPKYVGKLDKAMQKSGFRKVNDPNVQYRAYTNGTVVVDDVSPGNVGLTFFKKPKLLDFNLQTVPSWTSQGFTLKNGGKFKS